ncbi:MAG TPA: hypothetical protein PLB25_04460 [Rhodoferax sp.]|nr:hypothetical protein [Rhodoferax sp.]
MIITFVVAACLLRSQQSWCPLSWRSLRKCSQIVCTIRVVRAEHDNYFYPDFVVCPRHYPADEPIARLLETKDDTKDAARKSQHSPAGYGKVLFLTPDGNRMR